jgi:hypothetical protein
MMVNWVSTQIIGNASNQSPTAMAPGTPSRPLSVTNDRIFMDQIPGNEPKGEPAQPANRKTWSYNLDVWGQ